MGGKSCLMPLPFEEKITVFSAKVVLTLIRDVKLDEDGTLDSAEFVGWEPRFVMDDDDDDDEDDDDDDC